MQQRIFSPNTDSFILHDTIENTMLTMQVISKKQTKYWSLRRIWWKILFKIIKNMNCCSSFEQIRLPIEMSKQSEILEVSFVIDHLMNDLYCEKVDSLSWLKPNMLNIWYNFFYMHSVNCLVTNDVVKIIDSHNISVC